MSRIVAAFACVAVVAACSSSSDDGIGASPSSDLSPTDPSASGGSSSTSSGASPSGTGSTGGAGAGASSGSADGGADAAPSSGGAVTAAELEALASACKKKVSTSPLAKDEGGTANIDVCGLTGAVFWKADLDVDCDGKSSAVCNKSTDGAYQPATAASDSKGQPLDASKLPYVVVPLVSGRFDYKKAGLALGNVVAVVYKGNVAYGVIGDLGPASIIGEASYAMAKSLGINPDPSVGGTDSGVLYIAFTGAAAKIAPIEDHAKAASAGAALANKLVADNK